MRKKTYDAERRKRAQKLKEQIRYGEHAPLPEPDAKALHALKEELTKSIINAHRMLSDPKSK